MSKYSQRPLDFTKLETVPLKERGGKVKAGDFAAPYRQGSGITGWLDSLPHILAGNGFRAVVDAMSTARASGRAILWGLGGHVIKCGLAPVLVDLMQRGYATAFALNGAAAIHDFEIALAGHTSEDVEAVLPDGRFGAAEETGREMNRAISEGNRDGLGIGEALGRWLEADAPKEHGAASLLLEAYRNSTPVTVHVTIGADTPHIHPAVDAAGIGSAGHHDFRLFSASAVALNQGGVYLNVGSAVVLPEVFLKAVAAVRNLGYPLENFTTANFDFIQHYRPRVNVVERPHLGQPNRPAAPGVAGGGHAITGHHELMIPLLAATLIEKN